MPAMQVVGVFIFGNISLRFGGIVNPRPFLLLKYFGIFLATYSRRS